MVVIVYRLMSKEELDLYLSGDIEKIGKCFTKGKRPNNHKYKPNEKYVHMFRRLEDIEYIKRISEFEYVAAFDIPMLVLLSSVGIGYYYKIDSGYDYYDDKKLIEFAINTKKMKSSYFKGYKKVNEIKLNKDSD